MTRAQQAASLSAGTLQERRRRFRAMSVLMIVVRRLPSNNAARGLWEGALDAQRIFLGDDARQWGIRVHAPWRKRFARKWKIDLSTGRHYAGHPYQRRGRCRIARLRNVEPLLPESGSSPVRDKANGTKSGYPCRIPY
jgi:hypothetical protein